MNNEFLTVTETARELRISPQGVRFLARTGRLTPAIVTAGGMRLFWREAVERLARERQAAAQ